MANALVVFTPRSGSTIISDLLAYKYNALNLDEFIDARIRSVLYDNIPEDIKIVIEERSLLSEVPTPKTPQESQLYYYRVLNNFKKKFEFVKEIAQKYPVVVKYYPTAVLPGIKFVEWAIENNFELYFISRRNFHKQLYSLLLAHTKSRLYKAANKAGKLKLSGMDAYLNVKGNLNVSFPPQKLALHTATEEIVKLTIMNNLWRSYINAYGKYGKVMYYEDTVVKGDYSLLNISSDLLQAYAKEKNSLRPTQKYNIGDQITNWQEILEIAQYYEVPNLHE